MESSIRPGVAEKMLKFEFDHSNTLKDFIAFASSAEDIFSGK